VDEEIGYWEGVIVKKRSDCANTAFSPRYSRGGGNPFGKYQISNQNGLITK